MDKSQESNCICNQYDINIAEYEKIRCKSCNLVSHKFCYEMIIDDQNFICIPCRLNLFDPYYILQKKVSDFKMTSSKLSQNLQYIIKIDSQDELMEYQSEDSFLILFCTRVKVQNKNSRYEWPECKVQVTVNNKHSFEIQNKNILVNFNDHNVFLNIGIRCLNQKGKNSIHINFIGTVSQLCVLGLYQANIRDIKEISKLISILFQQSKVHKGFAQNFQKFFEKEQQGQKEIQMKGMKISLKDPLTQSGDIMLLPSRGGSCNHIQCFDLKTFLQFNQIHKQWKCPLCQQVMLWDKIDVDKDLTYIFQDVFNHIMRRQLLVQDYDFIFVNKQLEWSLIGEVDDKIQGINSVKKVKQQNECLLDNNNDLMNIDNNHQNYQQNNRQNYFQQNKNRIIQINNTQTQSNQRFQQKYSQNAFQDPEQLKQRNIQILTSFHKLGIPASNLSKKLLREIPLSKMIDDAFIKQSENFSKDLQINWMITVKIFSQDIQKLDLTSFYDLLESLNIIKGALNKNHIFAQPQRYFKYNQSLDSCAKEIYNQPSIGKLASIIFVWAQVKNINIMMERYKQNIRMQINQIHTYTQFHYHDLNKIFNIKY